MNRLIPALSLLTLLAIATIHASPLDLQTAPTGVKSLKNHTGTPDSKGVMETYTLETPAFKRGVYYVSQWWPYGGNRVGAKHITKPEGKEGAIFLMLELINGEYLAVLPLSGDKAYSWLATDKSHFILKLGTHGTATIKGDLPLVAWARGASPYEASAKVWTAASETAQIKGNMKLRSDKGYPEMFRYLGWCSWEEFHKNITSDSLVKQIKGLAASKAPVRYVLVDDGHFDPQTTAPKEDTFPQGYKPLTDLRTKDGISWIGMWYALMGESNAIRPGKLKSDYMMTTASNQLIAKPDPESARKFLTYMFNHSKRDGIDFLKVDFYGGLLPRYAGTQQKGVTSNFPKDNTNAIGNPAEATVNYARVYQDVVEKMFSGLMNCNWHQPQFIFNSKNSSVGRCSADYSKGNLAKAKAHLYDSYASTPWLGQIAWGDHDMFHSNDPFAGRMMAISKALSAAPVYLSDPYDHIDIENVLPLSYADGLLLRPLAPAGPFVEDIFQPIGADRLYRVMAPLANQSVAVAVYNFRGDPKKKLQPEFTTTITTKDYASASGMIQPYPGDWKVPAEGLIIYDWDAKTAQRLKDDGYKTSIKGFGDRLLQISPIVNGWSIIGRTDKYLSAAAVEILDNSKEKITVRLHESGPFSLWLAQGKPVASGVDFTDHGNGLFTANLPVKAEPIKVTISNSQ